MKFESQESVFNIALAYLERTNKILYKTQEAAVSENIDEWYKYLMALFRELSIKLEPEEKEEIFGKLNKSVDINKLLDLNIEESEVNFISINRLLSNIEIKTNNKSIILFLLHELDIKIRGKLQKKGMLLPSKSDPRYAIMNR